MCTIVIYRNIIVFRKYRLRYLKINIKIKICMMFTAYSPIAQKKILLCFCAHVCVREERKKKEQMYKILTSEEFY